MQLAWGNIDVSTFAFPVGMAMGGALTALLFVAEREYEHRAWMRKLRAPGTAVTLLILITLYCIVGGTFPQLSGFTTSIPFVAILIALMAHLTLVMVHRARHFASIRRDGPFLVLHGGIWLALFSGMAGAGDTKELRTLLMRDAAMDAAVHTTMDATMDTMEDAAVRTAYDAHGHRVPLSYSLRLQQIDITRSEKDGTPVQYEVTLLIDSTECKVSVNHPYAVKWYEEIYLMDLNTTGEKGCILLIVQQPWKYVTLTGILLLLAGTVWNLQVRRKEENNA